MPSPVDNSVICISEETPNCLEPCVKTGSTTVLDMGKRDYGSLGFVKNDVWTMAKEEVVDLANYARFLYYKISAIEEVVEHYKGDE